MAVCGAFVTSLDQLVHEQQSAELLLTYSVQIFRVLCYVMISMRLVEELVETP